MKGHCGSRACLSDPDPFGVCFSSVFVRMFEPQIVGYFAIILPVVRAHMMRVVGDW